MPQGDRTGPAGAGPRTGRGIGDCTVNTPLQRTGFGRGGLRLGRGGLRLGRGRK